MIEQQIREQNLPGVIVAVSIPGAGDYIAALGKANLETGRGIGHVKTFINDTFGHRHMVKITKCLLHRRVVARCLFLSPLHSRDVALPVFHLQRVAR